MIYNHHTGCKSLQETLSEPSPGTDLRGPGLPCERPWRSNCPNSRRCRWCSRGDRDPREPSSSWENHGSYDGTSWPIIEKCYGKIMGKYGNIGKTNKETREDPVLFFVLACIISTTEWSAMEYTIDNPRSGLAGMATESLGHARPLKNNGMRGAGVETNINNPMQYGCV